MDPDSDWIPPTQVHQHGARAPGPQQLDSSVGTGFWLDEVCMYVYENSGRMFGRGILAGGSLRDFDGVHLEHRKIFYQVAWSPSAKLNAIFFDFMRMLLPALPALSTGAGWRYQRSSSRQPQQQGGIHACMMPWRICLRIEDIR
jgi:hypothetical protein